MRLLLLGGTKFLGRAAAEEALRRGHEVTLFNRGQTNPDLFPEAEHLHGDRDGDLDALRGREWDAVIDPSGYVPRVVRASAELLQRRGRPLRLRLERLRLPRLLDARTSTRPRRASSSTTRPSRRSWSTTAALKALCEDVVAEVFPGRSANVRAGLIVGPHDPTDRFTYWPVRVARGGEVLAPGPARPAGRVRRRARPRRLARHRRRAAHERRLQRDP